MGDPVLETTRDVVRDVLPGAGQSRAAGIVPPEQGTTAQDGARTGSDLPLPPPDLSPSALDRASLEQSVANLCSALKGLGLSSGMTILSVTGFTGTIMARLDSIRVGGGDAAPSGAGNDGKMALGALSKAQPAPPPGTAGPLTVYASGTLLAGNSSDMPNAAGFSYGATSGMIGLEYSVSRYLILGLAASFTRMDSDLTSGAATDADIVHGAVYMSYSTRHWFIDALAAYGSVTLDMARPGAITTVQGSTDASALGLAVRGGYLFDTGKVRVGPIAGLSFVSAKVDGYTEAGPDPTAMAVSEQSIDSLTGSAGVRFLAPFKAGGTLIVPYLNVTLEHQFGNGKGSITTSLTQSPGAPVALSFPVFGARDYGKIEGGLTVELAPETSISLSGASTFAREDGQDYRFGVGLNWRF